MRPSGTDSVIAAEGLRAGLRAPHRERTLFWRSNRWGLQHAVRQGDWKYLRIDKPQGKRSETGELLFDLRHDPQERKNLAASQPEFLDRLRSLYTAWEAKVLPSIEPVAAPRAAAAAVN